MNKDINRQTIKKIVGFQKRLVAETEKALRSEINLRLKPIRSFLFVNKGHIEEATRADMVCTLKTIEDKLYVHLRIKWAQDGIDKLIERQRRADVIDAKKMAARLRGFDEEDDEEEDDDDDDDDDYIAPTTRRKIRERSKPNTNYVK